MSGKPIFINKDGARSIQDFLDRKGSRLQAESALRSIFAEKAPDYTEIEVSFFQLCAMHCSFCWQDNYDPTGISSIAAKADIAIDYLVREKSRLQPNIQVHMLGGELFEDRNDYYDQYFDFISRIQDHCSRELPEKRVLFVFLTNMNFQRDETRAKLDAFLARLESIGARFVLTTSWDPTGRPLAGETGTKFHQNITHFKRHIAEVTFVLTRPTISRIVQGKTAYLDLLVESGFEIDFDYYMPTAKTEQLMPSDREILEALRVLVRRYPKIRKLRQWTDLKDVPVSTKITCASLNKITILPDGTLTNCRHLNYDQSDFATRILNESNSDMIFNYLARKDCLSCPYFMKCPFSCFVMSDHRTFQARSELDDCLYRILFNETSGREGAHEHA